MTMLMSRAKFDKAAVPQEAINEFAAADAGLRQGYTHFLNGFRLAAEGVAKEFGGFYELKSPRDQKAVFKIVQEAARQAVKLSPQTFDRYCKIARYCIIYHADWDIAAEATRQQLRWCKQRSSEFKTGTREERFRRAWDERVELDKEQAKKKKKEEEEWLAAHGSKEPGEPNTKTLVYIPLPDGVQDEDAYWTSYLTAQVAHIQKHMDMLGGGGEVKTVVLNFFGAALPIVKKAKPKPMNSAAQLTEVSK